MKTKPEILNEAKKIAHFSFWGWLGLLFLFSMILMLVPLYYFLVHQTLPPFSELAVVVGFQILFLLSMAMLIRWYKRKVKVLRRVIFEGVKIRATVWRSPVVKEDITTIQKLQLRWHEGETLKEGHSQWATDGTLLKPLLMPGEEVEILLDPEEGKVFVVAMEEYPVFVGEVSETTMTGSRNQEK